MKKEQSDFLTNHSTYEMNAHNRKAEIRKEKPSEIRIRGRQIIFSRAPCSRTSFALFSVRYFAAVPRHIQLESVAN